MEKEYKVKLNITLDREYKDFLKVKAIKENTTVSNIITEFVKMLMDKETEV